MKEGQRPLILVSNDDSINSKGIAHLVSLMKELGEVVVVAPNSPQSGMGHAITITDPLRYFEVDLFEGVKAYECSGTPADCVKIAKTHLLDRAPDLVVSGINHGSNTSVSVLYSGTMSAALEATIEDLPAVGFSLCDYDMDADFSHTSEHILQITRQVLERGLPKGISLNVNFPMRMEGEPIKGRKLCRQAKGKWKEALEERMDPLNRKYLWLTGHYVNQDQGEDTDEWAIANNYVSVVPVKVDMTCHETLSYLTEEWN
ncbi:5'/3'-nucleotidase SurE [Algivirga pacifica]|uniref:5'-nucleotidase SurE n=1 Tax=Algivirga pacifica TaxID=1162670 RepID=A0ABP9DAJ0_9BACT